MRKIVLLYIFLPLLLIIALYTLSKYSKSKNFSNEESSTTVSQTTNSQTEVNNKEGPQPVVETKTPTQTVDESGKIIDEEINKLTDDSLPLDDL